MALYLVGDEDVDKENSGFFFLDPHVTQPSVPSRDASSGLYVPYLKQYHCTDVRTLDPSDMCTSLAPGFYLRTKSEYLKWKEQIKALHLEFKDQCIFSMFEKHPFLIRSPMATREEHKNSKDDLGSSFDDLNDFDDLGLGSRPQLQQRQHGLSPSVANHKAFALNIPRVGKAETNQAMGPE